VTTGALEGLSERAYNIVGMYEKGPLALRLAYSWRSEFNVTAIDCCVARPIWQDDSGYLDGSIRYGINERLEISLQGSNLLNTETVLTQQVTNIEDGGLRLPNAWFQNDRRFVLGLRYKY
jgi:outer membrane receptor protein involved in Fe transport